MEQRLLVIAHFEHILPIEKLNNVGKEDVTTILNIIKEHGLEHVNTEILMSGKQCHYTAEAIMEYIGGELRVSSMKEITFERNLPNFLNEIVNKSYRTPVVIAVSQFNLKEFLRNMNVDIQNETQLALCDLEKGSIIFASKNEPVLS